MSPTSRSPDGEHAAKLLRVLYLTKVYPYPPAVAGDAVYSRGIIEALSSYCQLTVLCCGNGGKDQRDSGIDWHIAGQPLAGQAGSLLSPWPLIAWKFGTAQYSLALDTLLERPWDAVVLDNVGSAHALPQVVRYRHRRPATRVVYVSHEYEYATRSAKYGAYGMALPKRLAAKWDLHKVRKSESALLAQADIVTVINDVDLEPFKKICPSKKYFPLLPGYSGAVLEQRTIDAQTPRRVLLLGGRRSEQKRRILLDWLHISYDRMLNKNIETVIAGDMEESLRQLIINTYPAVRVLGFVEDLQDLIGSARIGIIADTVGGGFKLRLLSHVFERLPIVGLSDAIAGLPTTDGEGYLGAETLEKLLQLVCDVIDDTNRLNQLQNAAFSDCTSAFSWPSRGAGLAHAISDPTGDTLL